MDEAGPGAGERQQAGHPRLGQPARHPVAAREPPRPQRARKRAHRRLQPGEIERPAFVTKAGASGAPRRVR